MATKPPTDFDQRRLDDAYNAMRQARIVHYASLKAMSGKNLVTATETERELRKALRMACDKYETIYAEVCS